jgi:hypothetical protein
VAGKESRGDLVTVGKPENLLANLNADCLIRWPVQGRLLAGKINQNRGHRT